jgi:hypothetical protein
MEPTLEDLAETRQGAIDDQIDGPTRRRYLRTVNKLLWYPDRAGIEVHLNDCP